VPASAGTTDAEIGEAASARELFPPGPLAAVRISPPRVAVPPGGERRVRAVPVDADGRRLTTAVEFAWSIVEAPMFSLAGGAERPAIWADAGALPGAAGRLRVVATAADRRAEAEADLIVEERAPAPGESGFGIPEPELVNDAGAGWRSRFDGRRWEVNAGHSDYLALAGEGRARFRYLLALLTREIVQRTHGAPGSDAALDAFIDILAHAERNLKDPGPPGRHPPHGSISNA
jgi:hypothetical protein